MLSFLRCANPHGILCQLFFGGHFIHYSYFWMFYAYTWYLQFGFVAINSASNRKNFAHFLYVLIVFFLTSISLPVQLFIVSKGYNFVFLFTCFRYFSNKIADMSVFQVTNYSENAIYAVLVWHETVMDASWAMDRSFQKFRWYDFTSSCDLRKGKFTLKFWIVHDFLETMLETSMGGMRWQSWDIV